ncbi:MAG: ATP-binding protein [Gemmatimonadota bacterium]
MDDMERPGRIEDLHQLTRLSREFTYARSLDEILDLAVSQSAHLMRSEKAVLLLTDDDGLLRVRASIGVDAEIVERFRQPANEALVSRLRGLLGANLAGGFVGVPLVSHGNVVGLLATVRPDGLPVSEDDEWLLAALADQIAAPLENARLAKQLESSALLAENVRLYEAEHEARVVAEVALREAESARDAALQADTSKTSFLAAMSHELRTPLNAIGGYVELLEMGLRGPITVEQADDLRRIKASQAHLLRLITEVLDFARLGSGHTELHFDDVDLHEILREAEIMTMPQARARGIEYAYEPLDCRVIVRADPHRLQQIVLNLLTNAIKFTEPGGAIRMTCGPVSGGSTGQKRVRVSVQDTGRGIPPDQIDGIWQPFVQVGRKLNHPSEGVGLGLAISRDLARRLGGELSVTSELGRGSEFTLTLPVLRMGQ